MTKLHQENCTTCTKDTPQLSIEEQQNLLNEVEKDWTIVNNHHLYRTLSFKNFKDAVAHLNAISDIAEYEGHHPTITLSWGNLDITIFTHSINGLSKSDFILASKIDQLSAI